MAESVYKVIEPVSTSGEPERRPLARRWPRQVGPCVIFESPRWLNWTFSSRMGRSRRIELGSRFLSSTRMATELRHPSRTVATCLFH